MFQDAILAFGQTFSPPFRRILWRVLGLTLLVLLVAGVGADRLLVGLLPSLPGWAAATVSVLAGVGLLVGATFLVAPVSSLVAGFYVDDLADVVEAGLGGPVGRALSVGQASVVGARFALVSLLVNAVALALLLVPGVNAAVFLFSNAYLMGRLFFELAALRHMPWAQADALRRRCAPTVLLAGFVIALFLSVPLLNLVTPLFGTALMVRVFRRAAGAQATPLDQAVMRSN